MLFGRNPRPTDDLTPAQARIAAARAALGKRSAFASGCAVVDLEDPRLAEVAARPEVQSEFGTMQWRPATVDLREVLAFQKIVFVDGLEERVAQHADADRLFDLCLPTERASLPVGAFKDGDGKGFMVSSLNPNLRVVGADIQEINVQNGPNLPARTMRAVMFILSMGASFVQVAHYRGRHFLRDGYHRAAGLLARGVHCVPCILIEARTFAEVVGAAAEGAFSYEVLFGERPPRLLDFWDDAVAADITQVAVRKVLRLRGEEFVVPR